MGANALTRFSDQSNNQPRHVALNWTMPEKWRIDRLYVLSLYVRNLQLLAQTRVYDQK